MIIYGYNPMVVVFHFMIIKQISLYLLALLMEISSGNLLIVVIYLIQIVRVICGCVHRLGGLERFSFYKPHFNLFTPISKDLELQEK